jgi:hypothetical protein
VSAKKTTALQDLLIIAKDFLKLVTGELDPYSDTKGIIEVGKARVTLFTPSHIQFAKYGRGPGKKPPFDSILEFVKKEKIRFEGTDERGTAFAIQASIGKNGTKGYKKNAPNALEEAIKNNYNGMSKKMARSLQVSYQKEIKGILEKIKLESTYRI